MFEGHCLFDLEDWERLHGWMGMSLQNMEMEMEMEMKD